VCSSDLIGGAGGAIRLLAGTRAAPDGYTLVLAPESTLLVTPIASKGPAYDWKSFEPVAFPVKSAVGFVVHPSAPFRTLNEIAAYAKAHPGERSRALDARRQGNRAATGLTPRRIMTWSGHRAASFRPGVTLRLTAQIGAASITL